MLGSAVLETAIGLVFVYLIFSLIASAIAEYIAALFDRRGEHLKHILFNLFDTDDPQGRTILKLVMTHPTLQALNSTDWKPKFQSAAVRLGDLKKESQLVKNQWNAASRAVATATAARNAALKADDCATRATAAVSGVKTALDEVYPTNAASVLDLQNSVTTAESIAAAALAAATAADQAAKAAPSRKRMSRSRGPHTQVPPPRRPARRRGRRVLDPSAAVPTDATPARSPEAAATRSVPESLPPAAAPSQPDPAPIPAGGT